VRAVLADPGRARALGAQNRRTVEQRFAAGPCLDRFLAVYAATRLR
jgi:hypothetical protein